MGSGMNGQHFEFVGYLPIDRNERIKAIREVEALSKNKNCTELFIETPYRNNQLFESLLKTCQPSTQLCIAAELTSSHEWIKTKLISEWKKDTIDLHKKTVIFLLYAGNI
jgi:16S rRNA (cytidine1402-2'-O)-methyltransferase